MRIWFAVLVALGVLIPDRAAGSDLYIPVGKETVAPLGWVGFCIKSEGGECDTKPMAAVDVALTPKDWNTLVFVNRLVNSRITYLTDQEHWGAHVLDRWSYPDDGYGDCEDYVLLKRRMLISLGWPRQALLVTLVRDPNGIGHAVLTVKTNKGEFILDIQEEQILLWSQSKHLFVSRQSQTDPNKWVYLRGPSQVSAVQQKKR
ncbi:MAG: transglutaminase-like cysteine peptidase [Patescibacteria group bacterium]